MVDICVQPTTLTGVAGAVEADGFGLVRLASSLRQGPLAERLGLPVLDEAREGLADAAARAADNLADRCQAHARRLRSAADAYAEVEAAVATAAA